MKTMVVNASVAELEQLRELVSLRAPRARFQGQTPSGLNCGEYRFALMMGCSIYVQSPTTPTGRLRARVGVWKYSLYGHPWRFANEIDTVVEFIREQSERAWRPG